MGGLAIGGRTGERTRPHAAGGARPFPRTWLRPHDGGADRGRAGVTERTYFRHFADKREVLFDGQEILRAALTASIADAPTALAPLDAMFRAFHSVVPALEANREFAVPRQEVIATTPALQERELAKLAALADALTEQLRSRGVSDLQATLASRTGMAAFADAATGWLDDPSIPLGHRLDLALEALRSLVGERPVADR